MKHEEQSLEVRFGLPPVVRYCTKCVMSNQRPSSTVEFKNKVNFEEGVFKEVINFDDEGVCSACRFHEKKYNEIDWESREGMLVELLDRHRRKDGRYDIIVPGSGGKDSVYVAHVLKYKYGMHPLTVTWAPTIYTDIGWKNFVEWLRSGFENVTYHANQKIHRFLTREAFLNLLHPWQPFILGQKRVAPWTALNYGIKLIMHGEASGENGSDVSAALVPKMNTKFFAAPKDQLKDIELGGHSYSELLDLGWEESDLQSYVPLSLEEVEEAGIEVHHMSYYKHWRPQENFYYAAENCGFQPNPERTEGTYSKYVSLDDKLDGFHLWTTWIKFGVGRAMYDASQEIRNKHITREEGVALVRKYDGEFPKKYFGEFLEFVDISEDRFWETVDSYRSPHLWKKEGNDWVLRHPIV